MLQEIAKQANILVPDLHISWCIYQLILAVQSFVLLVLSLYLIANEISRHAYIGVQKLQMSESSTLAEYLKDKSRLNEMEKFNPKLFEESQVIEQSASRKNRNICKGILKGLKYMLLNSAKFYIFLGLFILNLCKSLTHI